VKRDLIDRLSVRNRQWRAKATVAVETYTGKGI
jgi:hypothetical protein